MRSLSWLCYLLVLRLVVAGGVSAGADLDPLLGDLGLQLPSEKQGRVRVLARVERDSHGGTALAIDLVPEGAARLLANPGVSANGIPSDQVRWPAGREVRTALPGTAYFAAPIVIRLPVEAPAGAMVEAEVDYAWCLVDWLCIFGHERVQAIMPDAAVPAN